MKNISIIFFGIIILLFSNSCKNSHTKEIATLDSLMQVVANAENSLLEIDSVKIQKYADEIMETLHKFKEETKTPPSAEDAELLLNYRTSAKSFYAFNKNRKYLNEELFLSIQQLSNLKKDLQKNLISEEKAFEYYKTEVMETRKLLDLISMNIKSTQAEIENCQALKPKIDSLIYAK